MCVFFTAYIAAPTHLIRSSLAMNQKHHARHAVSTHIGTHGQHGFGRLLARGHIQIKKVQGQSVQTTLFALLYFGI